jgi:asparagine synthase (glutamine-hydrolysing)
VSGFLGDFDPGLLDRMNQVQAHRGPDDAGILSLPSVGLGFAHRRLSIIDVSEAGHQPMWDRDGHVVIVYNGEIYNYKELRSDLVSKGFTFQSQTDTEVLLNLFLERGHSMLASLNGMFAFALWDSRTNELFLARDGAGVKPLYFAETSDGFLFASELKAILQTNIDRSIDPEAVRDYITYLWCPAPRTMLRGVRKLEPGCALIVQGGTVRKAWQFYELPFVEGLEEGMTAEDALSRVRSHLDRAVRRQLVADVPVGAFLSGGLDSSSIVAFARRAQPDRRIQCFTIAPPASDETSEGFVQDLPYARKVATHLGVDLHVAQVFPDVASELERMVYHLDEPQADFAAINVLIISRLAREHGIKVLLSGAGGDDIFTGYRRHAAVNFERYWAWMPKGARGALAATARRLPAARPQLRRVAKALNYAGLDEAERVAAYFHWLQPEELRSIEGPLLRAHPRPMLEFSPPLMDSLAELPESVSPLGKMLYLDAKHFLADHNLNYTDKMGMAAGVEIRVPFLDPDLMSLAARVPLKLRQRGLKGKWVLKQAMRPYLPTEIIHRPKTGFGAPVRAWLRGDLQQLVRDVLSPSAISNRGLFDPAAVQALISRDQEGLIDAAYPILSLLCIELWCRQNAVA